MIGYCMKCRVKVEMQDVVTKEKDTSRGKVFLNNGKCSVCGGKVFKIDKPKKVK